MPARRAAASKSRASGSGWRPRSPGRAERSRSTSRKGAPGMWPASQSGSPAPGLAELEAAVDDHEARVAEPLAQLAGLDQVAHGPSVRFARCARWSWTRRARPLRPADLEAPRPGPGELLLEVAACGVCRTDLHVVDGELPEPKLPLVPGHQIVARVAGGGGERFARRRPRGRALARLDLRRVPLLPLGPREPLRPRALHRLPARRRLRRAGRGRRALLLPDPRRATPTSRPRRSSAPG